jgi:hypothetical protein
MERFRQQQALTAAFVALSAATHAEEPPDGLERRLLVMFEQHQPAGASGGTEVLPHRRPALPSYWGVGQRQWLRTAAVVALTAGAAIAWWQISPLSPGRGAGANARSSTPAASAPMPQAQDSGSPAVQVTPAGAVATRPAPSRDARTGPRRAVTSRSRPPRLVVAEGFVALPWASALPDFDRGEIVRIEIPLTALPLYGMEITPDAEDKPVRADLLVGQDGHPRAIRLVTNEPQ